MWLFCSFLPLLVVLTFLPLHPHRTSLICPFHDGPFRSVTIATISPHLIFPTPSFLLCKYNSQALSPFPQVFPCSCLLKVFLNSSIWHHPLKTKLPKLSTLLVGGRGKLGQMAGDSHLPQSRFIVPTNALAEMNFGGIYYWLMLSLQWVETASIHHESLTFRTTGQWGDELNLV